MFRNWLYRSFLKEDEEILFVIRRHIKVEAPRILKVFLLGFAIPAFITWLFPSFLPFALLWGWIGLIRFVYLFFDWYYDAWLVTNVSIIHAVWDGFFRKSGTRTEYHHVDSISYDIQGFFATLFNFGTIVIEKSTGNQIIFEQAASPKKKVDLLLQYQDLFVTQKNVRDHSTLKNLMTDMLSHHFQEHVRNKKKQ